MKWITVILGCLMVFATTKSDAQGWVTLPASPNAGYRHDDLSFCSPDSGIITNQFGYVFLTPDGGTTWDTLFSPIHFYGRSVGMLNSSVFLVGQYGDFGGPTPADSNNLYITYNKGQNWIPVTNFSGPEPAGICGLSVVNDSVAMGVGRFEGPAVFIKTTNGGNTFQSMDMSTFSSGLVDCHFFSPDTGYAVGRSPNTTATTSVPTILYTTNGGVSWQTVYSGPVVSRWCWKISFPSRQVGYVSVENNPILGADTNYVLKTVDGGLTWTLLPVDKINSRLQGIGFINDSTGWVGETYRRKTTDGGLSWTTTTELEYFNRMRKVNDSTFYAVGNRLNKYDFLTSDNINIPGKESPISNLKGNPNPTNKNITLTYELKKKTALRLTLYTQAGVLVTTISLPASGPGKKTFDLNMQNYKSGLYYLVLYSELGSQTLEIIKSQH